MRDWGLIVTAQGSQCWNTAENNQTYAESVVSSVSSMQGSTVVVANRKANVPASFKNSVKVAPDNQGALCSALYALDEIDLQKTLIVAPGDFVIEFDVRQAIEEEFHNGLSEAFAVTIYSDDPRHSFARIDDSGRILEYCEKDPVSNIATTGIFGFRSAESFLDAGTWVLANDIRHAGKFYVSSAVNYFIMSGREVSNLQLTANEIGFQKFWGES
jgi:NDP-sugar pyrophosphorylase family protein